MSRLILLRSAANERSEIEPPKKRVLCTPRRGQVSECETEPLKKRVLCTPRSAANERSEIEPPKKRVLCTPQAPTKTKKVRPDFRTDSDLKPETVYYLSRMPFLNAAANFSGATFSVRS